MIAQLHKWLNGRTPRERGLLVIAAALACFLLAFVAARPLVAMIQSAEARRDEAVIRHGRVQALAQRHADAQRVARPGPPAVAAAAGAAMPLSDLLAMRARDAGIELAPDAQGVAPATPGSNSGGHRLRIAAIRAGSLLMWLQQLENEGLRVREIRMRKAGADLVSADVVVVQP